MSADAQTSGRDRRHEHLPDHLERVSEHGGRVLCLTCRRYVTVGPNGTEYGHQRRGHYAGDPLPEEHE